MEWNFELIVEGYLLGMCAIVGIMANIVAIPVFLRKRVQQPFHRLMLFLSIFDLLYLMASLMLFSVPLLYPSIPTYPFFTKSIPFILPTAHVGMTGSIYLTISMAVERYITVCHPFFKLSHNWPARYYIVPIALFSFLFNCPKYLELKVTKTVNHPPPVQEEVMIHVDELEEPATSMERMPEEPILEVNSTGPFSGAAVYAIQPTELRMNKQYIIGYIVWANFIVNCVFPFIILICLNVIIYRKLKKFQNEENVSQEAQALRMKECKLAQISFIIVFVFIICHSARWVPNVWELYELYMDVSEEDWPNFIENSTYMSHLLTTVNGTVNVLIFFIKHWSCNTRNCARLASNQTINTELIPLDGDPEEEGTRPRMPRNKFLRRARSLYPRKLLNVPPRRKFSCNAHRPDARISFQSSAEELNGTRKTIRISDATTVRRLSEETSFITIKENGN